MMRFSIRSKLISVPVKRPLVFFLNSAKRINNQSLNKLLTLE